MGFVAPLSIQEKSIHPGGLRAGHVVLNAVSYVQSLIRFMPSRSAAIRNIPG
jgi:hypothetical protein